MAVVKYTRDDDAYVVVGAKGGAPTDPSWSRNLATNPIVTLEADGETVEARATVAQGEDRDRMWARHVTAHPDEVKFPESRVASSQLSG